MVLEVLFEKCETNKLDVTLQNFIYKHTVDLKNVQGNKRKEKGRINRMSS